MFDEYNTIYIKQDMRLQGRKFSLLSDKKVIGTMEESLESTKDVGNQLLKLITLYHFTSLQLHVLDQEENVLGIIKKDKGYYKDFMLYSKEEEYLATIKPIVKVKSPMMTVIDANNEEIIKAIGGFGATDFSVIDCKTENQISTIKRRSLIYETVKDNFLNDDGYYIENVEHNSLITLSLLAMGVILDLYFFNK